MAIAPKIREHMQVIASDGRRMGLVDQLEGADRIRLIWLTASHGHHQLIPLAWVDHVDTHVFLNKASRFVAANWEHAAGLPARIGGHTAASA